MQRPDSQATAGTTPRLWAGLFIVLAVSAYFALTDAGPYLVSFSPTTYGPFWPNRNWLLPHVGAGVLALILGAVQLCLGILRRTGAWHRNLGRAYIGTIVVSAIAALMLIARGSVVGPVFGALLAPIAVIWIAFVALGWIAARGHRWQVHREWMIRSYAVALGFVLFRLAVELPLLPDWAFADRYTALIGATFLIILAAVEILLQWRRTAGAVAPSVELRAAS